MESCCACFATHRYALTQTPRPELRKPESNPKSNPDPEPNPISQNLLMKPTLEPKSTPAYAPSSSETLTWMSSSEKLARSLWRTKHQRAASRRDGCGRRCLVAKKQACDRKREYAVVRACERKEVRLDLIFLPQQCVPSAWRQLVGDNTHHRPTIFVCVS